MDDLARRLAIAGGDGIASDAASDLFAILANRELRLPTLIASQTRPANWVTELPDRIAAESILNRLANNARIIHLCQIDMRRHHNEQARAHHHHHGILLPTRWDTDTTKRHAPRSSTASPRD